MLYEKRKRGKEREERGRTGETDTTYETHVQRSMMTKTHCTEVDSILWRGDERVMSERRWCEVYTLSIITLPHQLSCFLFYKVPMQIDARDDKGGKKNIREDTGANRLFHSIASTLRPSDERLVAGRREGKNRS